MRNVVIICGVLFGLLGSACESEVFVKKGGTTSVDASPTPSPYSNGFAKPLPAEQKMYLNEGLKHQAAGKYPEAIEEFKKSIGAGNDDKEMFRRIAELYIALKKWEDAELYLREILDRDSEDAGAHGALAGVLVWQLGKYDEGLKEALISKEKTPSNTSHVVDRTIGKAYEGLGDYENAIKHYKIFLRGTSYAPDSDDYKDTKKRISELEKLVKAKK